MCAIKFDANKANLLCLFACLCLFYHFIFKYNKLRARWLNLIQITFSLNVPWSAVFVIILVVRHVGTGRLFRAVE